MKVKCSRCNSSNLAVLNRKCNYSHFQAPKGQCHYSEYSTIECTNCGKIWRTKAKYVDNLPNIN